MANMLDYLDWRGDLSLEESPFNEVDNLLLAELSFLDLDGIVPDVGEGERVPLGQAVEAWFRRHAGEEIRMGVLVPDQIVAMAEKMAESRRFGAMELDAFRFCLDAGRETQFAALAIHLGDGSLYLSFRGTDDTLVGWKEDFNMMFLSQVPSQRLALDYVKAVARHCPRRKLRLGGHSKGGNLAVYSAVHCPPAIQRRIQAIYNNDGPGFKESLLNTPGYQAICGRLTTIVPQSSVVGMLLEHDEKYTVVRSSSQGFDQHDGFSWEVRGPGFVHLEGMSAKGRTSSQAIRDFIGQMDDRQRAVFVDALFEVLGSTNAQTLSELDGDRIKALTAMVRSYTELSREGRQMLGRALKVLLQVSAAPLREGLEEKGQELRKRLNIK